MSHRIAMVGPVPVFDTSRAEIRLTLKNNFGLDPQPSSEPRHNAFRRSGSLPALATSLSDRMGVLGKDIDFLDHGGEGSKRKFLAAAELQMLAPWGCGRSGFLSTIAGGGEIWKIASSESGGANSEKFISAPQDAMQHPYDKGSPLVARKLGAPLMKVLLPFAQPSPPQQPQHPVAYWQARAHQLQSQVCSPEMLPPPRALRLSSHGTRKGSEGSRARLSSIPTFVPIIEQARLIRDSIFLSAISAAESTKEKEAVEHPAPSLEVELVALSSSSLLARKVRSTMQKRTKARAKKQVKKPKRSDGSESGSLHRQRMVLISCIESLRVRLRREPTSEEVRKRLESSGWQPFEIKVLLKLWAESGASLAPNGVRNEAGAGARTVVVETALGASDRAKPQAKDVIELCPATSTSNRAHVGLEIHLLQ